MVPPTRSCHITGLAHDLTCQATHCTMYPASHAIGTVLHQSQHIVSVYSYVRKYASSWFKFNLLYTAPALQLDQSKCMASVRTPLSTQVAHMVHIHWPLPLLSALTRGGLSMQPRWRHCPLQPTGPHAWPVARRGPAHRPTDWPTRAQPGHTLFVYASLTKQVFLLTPLLRY